jgi:hypothetical protein
MRAKHTALHTKLTDRFPLEMVAKWEAVAIAWETHVSGKNPYEETDTSKNNLIISLNFNIYFFVETTLKTVQAELAKEELDDAQSSGVLHEVLPNRFLLAGLEIEEQQ